MFKPVMNNPVDESLSVKEQIKQTLVDLRKIFDYKPLSKVFLNAHDVQSALEHLIPEPRPGSPGLNKIGAIFIMKDDYDGFYSSRYRESKSTFFHIPGSDMLYRVFPYEHEQNFPNEPAALMIGKKIGRASGKRARYHYCNIFEFCYEYAHVRKKQTVEQGYRFGYPFIILYRQKVAFRKLTEHQVLTIPRLAVANNWDRYVQMRTLYNRFLNIVEI